MCSPGFSQNFPTYFVLEPLRPGGAPDGAALDRKRAQGVLGRRSGRAQGGGAVQVLSQIQLTHSLKGAWFQPLSLPLDPSQKTGYKLCLFQLQLVSAWFQFNP